MHAGGFRAPDTHQAKERLRRRVLARRGKLRPPDLQAAAIALRDVLLSVSEVSRAAVVAAYVGVGTEPGTGPLLDALHRRGIRVLLPVLEPDFDIDWSVYTGPEGLVRATRGLLEPDGPRLGPTAVGTADAVLLPGLAVDKSGMRLGRGGGSYDRVLRRTAREAFRCVVLHEGEIVDGDVPSSRHDGRVQAAALPSGLVRFPVTADQPEPA
jgi:5-formyltetrahydrofolate cyclo-ligase